MSEMVQAGKYHAKRQMLDFLEFMGDRCIEAAQSSPDIHAQALSVRFGMLLKHYANGLGQSVFTEEDCRYFYGELKKAEPERVALLECSCLKPWQKHWEIVESRSRKWERSDLDEVRQDYGIDMEVDLHRSQRKKSLDDKGKFDDFMREGGYSVEGPVVGSSSVSRMDGRGSGR